MSDGWDEPVEEHEENEPEEHEPDEDERTARTVIVRTVKRRTNENPVAVLAPSSGRRRYFYWPD